jgi:hypothetical protein
MTDLEKRLHAAIDGVDTDGIVALLARINHIFTTYEPDWGDSVAGGGPVPHTRGRTPRRCGDARPR